MMVLVVNFGKFPSLSPQLLVQNQVIYGLLVSPTLTFFLAFGFYYFVYKTIVKVR